jgi:hypothetical protein
LQNFNLAALSATMVALVLSGAVRPDMWPQFAIVALALILPSMLGARVYVGLSPAAFRQVILGLLSLSGVAMTAAAFVSILRI